MRYNFNTFRPSMHINSIGDGDEDTPIAQIAEDLGNTSDSSGDVNVGNDRVYDASGDILTLDNRPYLDKY